MDEKKKTNRKKTTSKISVKKGTKETEASKKESPQQKVAKKKNIAKKKVLETTTFPKNLDKTIILSKDQTNNIKEVMKQLEAEQTILKEKSENRMQAKKIIIILLAILIALTIVMCTIYMTKNIMSANEPDTLKSNIYKKVVENTKKMDLNEIEPTEEESKYATILPISLNELEKKVIEKEDMAVLIAKETCYYSLTFEETIDAVLNREEKTIYKLNISHMEKEELERLRTYYRFTITPTIFKIENGIVTSELIEAQTEENFTRWVEENL